MRYDIRALCHGCRVSFPTRFSTCPNCRGPLVTQSVERIGPFQDTPRQVRA